MSRTSRITGQEHDRTRKSGSATTWGHFTSHHLYDFPVFCSPAFVLSVSGTFATEEEQDRWAVPHTGVEYFYRNNEPWMRLIYEYDWKARIKTIEQTTEISFYIRGCASDQPYTSLGIVGAVSQYNDFVYTLALISSAGITSGNLISYTQQTKDGPNHGATYTKDLDDVRDVREYRLSDL